MMRRFTMKRAQKNIPFLTYLGKQDTVAAATSFPHRRIPKKIYPGEL